MSNPTGNILFDHCCDGCKHLGYSAPEGQPTIPEPHNRCKLLKINVPVVKERGRVVFHDAPTDCPGRLRFAQRDLMEVMPR